MTPLLTGVFASQISGRLSPPYSLQGNYDALSTVIVPAGGVSTITFAGIPQTGYSDLQIRASFQTLRPTYTTDDVYYYYNNDGSGTSYSQHSFTAGVGSSPTVGAGGGASQSKNLLQWCATTTGAAASFQTACVIDIPEYANATKFKTSQSFQGYEINVNAAYAGTLTLGSGNWRSLDKINSITFTTDSGTGFAEYSTFALYGVK